MCPSALCRPPGLGGESGGLQQGGELSVCVKGGVGKGDLCIFAGGGERGQEGSEGCEKMD